MKKLVSLLLTVCLCLGVLVSLTACGHEHTFSTTWSKDQTHHWHACEGKDCTEVADKAEHTFNAGEITTAPSKAAAGTKTFTCTACGATKTEPVAYDPETTVTAEQFANAFNLGNNWTISFFAFHPVYEQKMSIVQKRADNKFHCIETMMDAAGTVLDTYEDFDEIVNNVWYGYRYDNNAQAFDKVTITDPVEQRLASMMDDYLPDCIKTFTDYTYDAQSKSYVAASILNTQSNTTLTNVSLSFEDGALVALSYVIDMEGAAVTYDATITYGDATVTLPTVVE